MNKKYISGLIALILWIGMVPAALAAPNTVQVTVQPLMLL